MRLTVLGGSGASPNAGAGCSGYLVETATSRIVLDLGPGTLAELRRHTDFRHLDGIVISHLHVDHVLDLLALRHALAYNPISAPAPIAVWLPPGGIEFLARATAPWDESDEPGRFAATIDVAEYDPNQEITVGDTTISFAPAVHYVPAWAMRIASDGAADLGYTADTGPAAELAPFFSGVGVLVAGTGLLEPSAEPFAKRGLLTATEAGELGRSADARTLILTHLWQELGFDRYRAVAASAFPGRLEVAHPGLAVEW